MLGITQPVWIIPEWPGACQTRLTTLPPPGQRGYGGLTVAREWCTL
jgi:hypothetical protein